jgi:hypothetical protein
MLPSGGKTEFTAEGDDDAVLYAFSLWSGKEIPKETIQRVEPPVSLVSLQVERFEDRPKSYAERRTHDEALILAHLADRNIHSTMSINFELGRKIPKATILKTLKHLEADNRVERRGRNWMLHQTASEGIRFAEVSHG